MALTCGYRHFNIRVFITECHHLFDITQSNSNPDIINSIFIHVLLFDPFQGIWSSPELTNPWTDTSPSQDHVQQGPHTA